MRNVGTTPTTTTSNNTSISSLSWLFFRTAKIRKSLNLILCHQFGPCFREHPWRFTSKKVWQPKLEERHLVMVTSLDVKLRAEVCQKPWNDAYRYGLCFIQKLSLKSQIIQVCFKNLRLSNVGTFLFQLVDPIRGVYLPVAKNHVRYSWAQLGLTWLVQGLVWTKISALQKPLHHWSRLKPRNFLGINRTNHPCEDENGQCWTTTCTHWIQNCDVELWKEIKSWEFGIQVPVFCNAPVQETVIHGGAHSKLPLIYSQYIIDHRNLSVESLKDLLWMCSHKLWIHWIHKNHVSPH